jgi:Tol biopolymer transport system component
LVEYSYHDFSEVVSMLSTRISRAAVCAVLFFIASLAPARAGKVDLVSRRDPGFVAPGLIGDAGEVVLSADGRWAAFTSTAPNLVAGQNDANDGADVFLLDRQSGTVTLVSHSALSPATTGTKPSEDLSISADGRLVAFRSSSGNLVSGEADGVSSFQVFVYDRDTGAVALASHKAGSSTGSANGNSSWPRISGDGSAIAFMSGATDLLAGGSDANGEADIFVYDVDTGTVSLVSHAAASATTAGSDSSVFPEISADGRYVFFSSEAQDLVSGQIDSASTSDLFLHDRMAGTAVLLSRATGTSATAANAASLSGSLSDDGAYVVFASWATNLVAGQVDTAFTTDAFLFERATGSVTLLSHADGAPATAAGGFGVISGDGAWIALVSPAANLVPGQADANGGSDVFLRQRATGATTLVSHAAGSAANAANAESPYARLSGDGRYLLFGSSATDLVSGQADANGARDGFLYDRIAGTTALVTHAQGSSASAGNAALEAVALSADGSWAAFTGAASDLTAEPDPGARDLFLYERASGANLAVTYGAPVIRRTPDNFSAFDFRGTSQDGRYIGMSGLGTDLAPGQVDTNSSLDTFLVDRLAGTTTLVSHAAGSPATASNGSSGYPVLSADGAWLAFDSDATDLIPNIQPPRFGGNVFLYERDSGAFTLVSRRASDPGLSGDGSSLWPSISGDGRYVAFSSLAENLVAGQVDTGSTADVFLYDRVTGGMSLVSHQPGAPLVASNGGSDPRPVDMTRDGRWVLFPSRATNLVSGQIEGNAGSDLFLWDRMTGSVVLVSRSASSPTTTANAETNLQSVLGMSQDGRWVAFLSPATNLVAGQVDTNGADDLFLFDRLSGTVTLVSRQNGTSATAGNGRSLLPAFSEDGLYLTFSSLSDNLVPGQSGVRRFDPFLYELATGTLTLLPTGGNPQTFVSTEPLGATAGARTILLLSGATDLVSGQVDVNAAGADLFLLDRVTGATKLVSRTPASPAATGNNGSSVGVLRAQGSLVVFRSTATDLAPGDFNGEEDVFVYSPGAAPASDFYTVAPCRALDTRSGSPLSSGVAGLATLHGVCGVPATAVAVAVNVTVAGATGSGNLRLYPGDVPPPAASSINFQAGVTRANNAMLSLSDDGAGTLGLLATIAGMAGGGTVHVIVDVVGYYQ